MSNKYPVRQLTTQFNDTQRGQNTSPHIQTGSGDWVPQSGTDAGELKVSDKDLLQKIEELNKKVEGIINGTTPVHVYGGYVRKSTSPKPTGKEGNSLYLWDTKQVFIHDGTEWREM